MYKTYRFGLLGIMFFYKIVIIVASSANIKILEYLMEKTISLMNKLNNNGERLDWK